MIEIEIYEEKTVGKKSKTSLLTKSRSKSYYDNEDIKYFNKSEYTLLIDKANKFYKYVYLLFFETGSRVEEAREIRYCDVDFDSNKIKVKISKQRNKNTYRVLPISDTLKAAMLQHKMENNLENDDYILSKKHSSTPIIRQAFDKKMKYDCELLRIEKSKAHMHTWRHTRAIQLLESGVDIIKVQKFLGHASIQNTLIYLKYSNKDFEKAIINANKNIGLL